jgi:stage IV sporulation protein B
MRKIVKSATGLFLLVSVILCTVIGFYYVHLPDKYYLSDGDSFNINAFFDITAESETVRQVYAPKGIIDKQVQLKLFGLFPIKNVTAEKISRPNLIPCGMPFGIKIITTGAIVTELGEVDSPNGFSSPAKDAGITPGDVIIKVNDMPITQNDDIAKAVQLNPESTSIVFTRDGQEMLANIIPVKSRRDSMYKIGMWVRDSSAGIGTMTYYNPVDSTFAGLGHAVCDVDTGQKLPLLKGEAVAVYISGVVKGFSGVPGELNGSFVSRVAIGTIKGNTESGVFGVMENPPVLNDEQPLCGAIPMAYKQEVQIGPATLISTIEGNSPKEYDVLIEKIDYSDKNKVKNMVVKITDKELLNKSGGIVQGMSGSPIVQNGRLAGAVTHVFVSDPSRGYAIFAENMYREQKGVIEQTDSSYMLQAA